MAIADKFGNISVVRLPQNTNDDVDEDPTGSKSLWDRGLLSGAGQKAECVTVFHVGRSTYIFLKIGIACMSVSFRYLILNLINKSFRGERLK